MPIDQKPTDILAADGIDASPSETALVAYTKDPGGTPQTVVTYWTNLFKGGFAALFGKLQLNAVTELTIASGAITVTKSRHLVDTEADAASDDLETINGGAESFVLIISPASAARTVVFKHGTGNILCVGEADIKLDELHSFAILLYDVTAGKWFAQGASAPTTTAANDFQVGDGLGDWIKKTLAQTKTILGLPTGSIDPPTATNDFLMGSGANWIKQTLAQARTALFQAATETLAGIVEPATAGEAAAGTDAARAVTPAGLRAGQLSLGTPSSVNIVGGVLTVPGSGLCSVVAEGGAPDDLNSISGGSIGDIVVLTIPSGGNAVTVKNNVGGGFRLVAAADFTLSHLFDSIVLRKGSATAWVEMSRADIL